MFCSHSRIPWTPRADSQSFHQWLHRRHSEACLWEGYEDGESPADISVAFIEIPAATHVEPTRVHAARLLTEECGLPEPGLFSHEIILKWAIPENYVLHTVSLQNLDGSWASVGAICPSGPELHPWSAAELQYCIARDLQHANRGYGPWEVGVYLAFLGMELWS